MGEKDREKRRFVALAFCRADLLFEIGHDNVVVFAAGATPGLFGKSPEDLIGQSFVDLIAEGDRKLVDQLFGAASRKGRLEEIVIHLNGAAGRQPYVALSGYRVPDFDDHLFVALKVEPLRVPDPAEVESNRDSETGLLGVDGFAKIAADRVKTFQRAGESPQVTMVKVEQLGQLIGTLGASDRVALQKSIGEVLRSVSVGGDTAAQIDEDSFSVIHTNDVDADLLNMEIERAAEPFEAPDLQIAATSVTLQADGAGMSEDQVAKALVHAMNSFCQNDGKTGATTLSESLADLMTDTMDSIAYVRQVTRSLEFDLHYMPICDLRKRQVVHFEALTRFRSQADRSPYHLIRLAEETGIMPDFDMAVVKKAIRDIKKFSRAEQFPPVAVNISGASLSNEAFVLSLHALLAKESWTAGRLYFELTESARVESLEVVNRAIQTLRKEGYKICLDDFGAGSASFDYLNILDVDVVKFDGPVVRRACSSAKGTDLLATMAKMCSKMSILSVAEMVEDQKMADQVFYLGVDYGQGWFFGKPTPDPLQYRDQFSRRLIKASASG